MRDDAARNGKPLILLLVLLLHCGLIDVLIRESKLGRVAKTEAAERLLVFFLPRDAPSTAAVKMTALTGRRVATTGSRKALDRRTSHPPRQRLLRPKQHHHPRSIGNTNWSWQRKSGITEAEKQKNYRDLSASLSPAQLNWLEQNHMQPAHPA